MAATEESLDALRAKRYRFKVSGVVGAATCLAGLAAVLACFGRFSWIPDVAGSFRSQYLIVSAMGVGLYIHRRAKIPSCLAIAIMLINGAVILPRYAGRVLPCEGTQIRLLSANVYSANTDHASLLSLIEIEDPDLILLMEVNQRWIQALEPLRQKYPHHIERPRADNFGIAFYARVPLEQLDIVRLGDADVPTVQARLTHEGGAWNLIATHPVPPTGKQYWDWRNQQLAEIATLSQSLQAAGEQVVVLGDLNAPPWSYYFRRLLSDAELRDASNGYGVGITWPANSWLFGIPIDHCLVSSDTRVCDRRNGPAIGSDHYPIVVDLALPLTH
ncbi:MAG: endonuclease/exonuclease/phosphatase (EEP) superfamily protein YafD [Rhodothermales bacterium]|jgi:endonuclease/exonuclease/phosphatase (EEP) superfamily protein YafD